MKFLALLSFIIVVVAISATPVQKQTTWCVTSWWPLLCAETSEDCVGWDRYSSLSACGGMDADAYASSTFYCVTSWEPKLCDVVGSDNCVGTDRFMSIESCGGMDASTYSVDDGFCVTSWWPKTCDVISSGDCVGWYPTGGYETSDECLGLPETTVDSGICVVSWWPMLCGDSDDYTCVGFDRYESVEDCGGQDASIYDGFEGYCVASWWPMACEAIVNEGENCVGWFPPGGFATQAACEGVTESENKIVASVVESKLKAEVNSMSKKNLKN